MSRRGRRPAGEDTRGAIVEAARQEFAEAGYDATSLRGVARRAGVDPALVHHYFDGKPGLFAAAMEVPLDPRALVQGVADGPLEGVGARLVRTFLGVWDAPEGRVRFRALVGSVSTHEDAARMLREFVVREIFGALVRRLAERHPEVSGADLETRAALAASQMLGIGLLRYVVELPVLAGADPEALVALVGPTVQRHLVGDPSPPSPPEV